MTVRLLMDYFGQPANSLITRSAAEETQLVNAKMASTDLTGGTTYTAPASNSKYTPAALFSTDSARNVTGILAPNGTIIPILNRYRAARRLGNVMTKMPFTKMTTSGLLQTIASTPWSSHIETAVESPYDSLRFIIPNNTNAIPGVIGKCATATAAGLDPTGTGNTANADGKTQNNGGTWQNITWGGAASVTLNAGIDVNRPVYTVADWVGQQSETRSDSATQSALPLVFSRFALPSSATVVNIPQWAYTGDLFAQNSFTGNWGNDVTGLVTNHRFLRQIYQNTDGVTTLANFTQNTLQCGMPVITQYATRRSGINVMVIGDSIAEGSSPAQAGVSATRAWGWAHRAVYALSTPDFPIELANFGWAAQTSAQYTQRLVDILKLNDADGFPVFRPDVLIYQPFSVNDGTPTSATIAAQAAQTAKVLGLCQTLNILPILFTGSLNNAYTLTQDAFRANFITQLRAMGTSADYIVLDSAGAWGAGATPERWASVMVTSDGTHPSDTAKDAAGLLLQSILSYIMGVR